MFIFIIHYSISIGFVAFKYYCFISAVPKLCTAMSQEHHKPIVGIRGPHENKTRVKLTIVFYYCIHITSSYCGSHVRHSD